ncbi:MAG: GNAT family N-acetyltransferase [Nocardioidaceae bacterium]
MTPSPDIVLESWSPDRTMKEAHRIYAVYDAVFGDVSDEADWVGQTLEKHRARDAFRFVAALKADAMIGFAYGYVGQRGQWWPDRVVETLPKDVTDDWVGGHFEFVELAVLSPYRRQGIGGRLHDVLMADLPTERALLGTDDTDSPAAHLYRSRGWFKIGNLTRDVAVLGWTAGDKVAE